MGGEFGVFLGFRFASVALLREPHCRVVRFRWFVRAGERKGWSPDPSANVRPTRCATGLKVTASSL